MHDIFLCIFGEGQEGPDAILKWYQKQESGCLCVVTLGILKQNCAVIFMFSCLDFSQDHCYVIDVGFPLKNIIRYIGIALQRKIYEADI